MYPRRLASPQTLRPGQVHEMQLTATHLRKREAEFSGNEREVICVCESCVCVSRPYQHTIYKYPQPQAGCVGAKRGVRIVSLSLVSSFFSLPFVSPAHDPSRTRRALSGIDYCVRSYLCTRSCGSHTLTETGTTTKRMGRKGYIPLEIRCLCDVFALQ